MTDQPSNFDAARGFAEFGLREREAGRRESASGPGSTLEAAGPAIELLRHVLVHERPETVLDLGERMERAIREPQGTNRGVSRYVCLYRFG